MNDTQEQGAAPTENYHVGFSRADKAKAIGIGVLFLGAALINGAIVLNSQEPGTESDTTTAPATAQPASP